jgi:hypothetical protein
MLGLGITVLGNGMYTRAQKKTCSPVTTNKSKKGAVFEFYNFRADPYLSGSGSIL